jgi:hypothetical protein
MWAPYAIGMKYGESIMGNPRASLRFFSMSRRQSERDVHALAAYDESEVEEALIRVLTTTSTQWRPHAASHWQISRKSS